MFKILAVVVGVAVLLACTQEFWRYQLISSGGKLWIYDRLTGSVETHGGKSLAEMYQ